MENNKKFQSRMFISANSFKDVHNNRFLEFFKQDFIDTYYNEEALLVSDYIVEEYSKNVPSGHDNEYKISALLTDKLLNKCGFEAVAYPSVKLGGQAGLNIPIRPDVADSKSKLLNIADQCYYKNGEHGIVRIESIYDVANECELPVNQESDYYLCQRIGISTFEELPLIN